MRHLPRAILSGARILASIFHHNMAYIDVRYDITMHRHVLSNDESCVTIGEFFISKIIFQMIRNVRQIYILLFAEKNF